MPEEEPKGSCEVCKKPAKQFCSSCKAVFYCSRDCQKRGWKEHKTKCRLFSLQVSPIFGRHLVATRDIKAGEVVLREAPLLVGPKLKSQPLCLGCHRQAREYRCSKCKYPVCGPGCEVAKYHKEECEILRLSSTAITAADSSKPHTAFSCITALRCLLTKTSDPKTWELINTMENHLADIKKGELYQYFLTTVVDYLRKHFGWDEHDEDTILKMCGIITTNAFELKHNGSRVSGLYQFASKMAHSCKPNTKHIFEDNLMTVFMATVKIPKGTTITTSYTQVLWNTMARRQHLKMVKFFSCECLRCSDPTELGTQYSTLLCDQCRSGILPQNSLKQDQEWICNKCSHVLSAKQVKWGDAVLFRELREMDKGNTLSLENFLVKYKETLHPQNRFIVEAKYALVKLYGNSAQNRYRDLDRSQLENKMKYSRELLELADVLDPGLSLLRGSILFELQAGIVALAKFLLSNDIISSSGAKEYMSEAAVILEEASVILKHEPEMRDGGLNDKLAKLSQELDI